MKMKKSANSKSWIFWGLMILPVIYMAVCWGIGLVYLRKPSLLGPYQVEMGTPIGESYPNWSLTSPAEKEADEKTRKMLESSPMFRDKAQYSAYEKRGIAFMYPRFEVVFFPEKEGWNTFGDGKYKERGFRIPHNGNIELLAFNPKKTEQTYVTPNEGELEEILHKGNNKRDLEIWKRYAWLRKFQASNFFWLVGNGAGSPLAAISGDGEIGIGEWTIPFDLLGMVGCLTLWITWVVKDLRIWFYYVYWVVAYWFGRIGFWSSDFAFKKEGWLSMFYNCFDWLYDELRLFLMLAIILSVPVILNIFFVYLTKHFIPRKKREIEDLLKGK